MTCDTLFLCPTPEHHLAHSVKSQDIANCWAQVSGVQQFFFWYPVVVSSANSTRTVPAWVMTVASSLWMRQITPVLLWVRPILMWDMRPERSKRIFPSLSVGSDGVVVERIENVLQLADGCRVLGGEVFLLSPREPFDLARGGGLKGFAVLLGDPV
jgi:hypothetical protein